MLLNVFFPFYLFIYFIFLVFICGGQAHSEIPECI